MNEKIKHTEEREHNWEAEAAEIRAAGERYLAGEDLPEVPDRDYDPEYEGEGDDDPSIGMGVDRIRATNSEDDPFFGNEYLRCRRCGWEWPGEPPQVVCPRCDRCFTCNGTRKQDIGEDGWQDCPTCTMDFFTDAEAILEEEEVEPDGRRIPMWAFDPYEVPPRPAHLPTPYDPEEV